MQVRRSSLLRGAREARGTVVVIDVFRAFTTLAVLHHLGAGPVRLVERPEEALALRASRGGRALGEVGGRPCPGFDAGNSPSHLLLEGAQRWKGQAVAMRSSAGVRGALAALAHGDAVFLGAFVTGDALVRTLLRRDPELVTLVAMGVDGARPAPEDEACADWLEARLLGQPWEIIETMERLLSSEETEKFLSGRHAHFPAADALLCLQRDLFPFALEAREMDDDGGIIVTVAD